MYGVISFHCELLYRASLLAGEDVAKANQFTFYWRSVSNKGPCLWPRFNGDYCHEKKEQIVFGRLEMYSLFIFTW